MERTTATALVLSYLAASGLACTKDAPAPIAAAPEAPSATPSAATTAAPSATPSPIASTTATATAKPKPPGGNDLGAKQCKSDTDCGPNMYCVLPFNGAGFGKGPGTCSSQPPIYEGRPLVVDAKAHVAREGTSDWSARVRPVLSASARDELRRAAFEEHASIAAFARTISALMALGAPRVLVERTAGALQDEIRHAAETFAFVEERPGALPAAIAPFVAYENLAASLVVDVFEGGCIGETRAADRLLERARDAEAPDLAAFSERLAHDEARHAALAFETAAWLAASFPEARRALDAALSRHDDPRMRPLFALLA